MPDPTVCAAAALIAAAGFVALAGEAWSAAEVAVFWRPAEAVVTGFRQEGRPRAPGEELSVVFVQATLSDGRQVSASTVNGRWRLRSWPADEVPARLGDRISVYVDPRNASRALPAREADALGYALFAGLFGLGVIFSLAGLVRSLRARDRETS